MQLNQLPPDMLLEILYFIHTEALGSLSRVSRKWKTICSPQYCFPHRHWPETLDNNNHPATALISIAELREPFLKCLSQRWGDDLVEIARHLQLPPHQPIPEEARLLSFNILKAIARRHPNTSDAYYRALTQQLSDEIHCHELSFFKRYYKNKKVFITGITCLMGILFFFFIHMLGPSREDILYATLCATLPLLYLLYVDSWSTRGSSLHYYLHSLQKDTPFSILFDDYQMTGAVKSDPPIDTKTTMLEFGKKLKAVTLHQNTPKETAKPIPPCIQELVSLPSLYSGPRILELGFFLSGDGQHIAPFRKLHLSREKMQQLAQELLGLFQPPPADGGRTAEATTSSTASLRQRK